MLDDVDRVGVTEVAHQGLFLKLLVHDDGGTLVHDVLQQQVFLLVQLLVHRVQGGHHGDAGQAVKQDELDDLHTLLGTVEPVLVLDVHDVRCHAHAGGVEVGGEGGCVGIVEGEDAISLGAELTDDEGLVPCRPQRIVELLGIGGDAALYGGIGRDKSDSHECTPHAFAGKQCERPLGRLCAYKKRLA